MNKLDKNNIKPYLVNMIKELNEDLKERNFSRCEFDFIYYVDKNWFDVVYNYECSQLLNNNVEYKKYLRQQLNNSLLNNGVYNFSLYEDLNYIY